MKIAGLTRLTPSSPFSPSRRRPLSITTKWYFVRSELGSGGRRFGVLRVQLGLSILALRSRFTRLGGRSGSEVRWVLAIGRTPKQG